MNGIRALALIPAVLVGLIAAPASAQSSPPGDDVSGEARMIREFWRKGEAKSVTVSLQLFDRMAQFQLPSGYVPIFKATAPGQFILEYVPDGQTLDNWTSMITVRALAGPGRLPIASDELADKLMRPVGCKGSNYTDLGELDVGAGLTTRVFAAGCGDTEGAAYAGAKKGMGEQTFGFVARGYDNLYTFTISQRGPSYDPSRLPLAPAGWRSVLAPLGKVLLCYDESTPECKDAFLLEKARAAIGKRAGD